MNQSCRDAHEASLHACGWALQGQRLRALLPDGAQSFRWRVLGVQPHPCLADGSMGAIRRFEADDTVHLPCRPSVRLFTLYRLSLRASSELYRSAELRITRHQAWKCRHRTYHHRGVASNSAPLPGSNANDLQSLRVVRRGYIPSSKSLRHKTTTTRRQMFLLFLTHLGCACSPTGGAAALKALGQMWRGSKSANSISKIVSDLCSAPKVRHQDTLRRTGYLF